MNEQILFVLHVIKSSEKRQFPPKLLLIPTYVCTYLHLSFRAISSSTSMTAPPPTQHHHSLRPSINKANNKFTIKMPHSITGKHRTKRPDTRPNAKKRKKQHAQAYEAAEAKDIISTRIPKSQQKERPVTGILKPDGDQMKMKRVRFLQKLLRQIESLKERQEGGEVLDEAQMRKVGRLEEVVEEIEELMDVNLDSSDEEEEEADDDKEKSEDEEESEEEEKQSLPVKR